MIIEMIYYSTFWLNSFPPADVVSETISPWGIVVQTHEEHNKTLANVHYRCHRSAPNRQ
jgi:hypothetical protein